jgi:hypothetical protein
MHSFEWLSLVPQISSGQVPIHVVHTLMVVAFLCTLILIASRRLRSPDTAGKR